MNVVRGRVWKFGDDVNTDMIVAGKYLAGRIEDAMPHALEAANPDFAKGVRAGDIVVGGGGTSAAARLARRRQRS